MVGADICHQVLDLYSQQPSRTDSPQGQNAIAAAASTKPAVPSNTPSKPNSGRGVGFDQRIDAMQPKVEVAGSAGYVNYAMGATTTVPVPANMNVAPPVGAPHGMPPVGFSFPGYSMIPPAAQNPPIPPANAPGFAPPLPPTQAAPFYAQYPTFPGQVFPPTPSAPHPPPPPPRPY